jgi:hypothetical protein
LLFFAACSGTTAQIAGPRAGAEGGPCPPPGTSCDVDLVCLSNLCVRPNPEPAGSDGGGGTKTDDAGTSGPDGSTADGSTAADTGADGPRDTGVDGDSGCIFRHPLVDAGARYCSAGQCYCKPADSCYPTSIAASCCSAAVTCY